METTEGKVLYIRPRRRGAIFTFRQRDAVVDPTAMVFELSVGQIAKRLRSATKTVGWGKEFKELLPPVGITQDLMIAPRWDSPTMPAKHTESQAAGGGAGGQALPGRPLAVRKWTVYAAISSIPNHLKFRTPTHEETGFLYRSHMASFADALNHSVQQRALLQPGIIMR